MDHAHNLLRNRHELGERLVTLWEITGDQGLMHLAEGRSPDGLRSGLSDHEYADWVSTTLMNAFKVSGASEVFTLLFELNRASFLAAIQCRVRSAYHSVDPHDVMQEVFLNIYRYPNNFHADHADSFRNWGHRIVRNTLIRFLKSENRHARPTSFDDEEVQWEDARARSPYLSAQESESAMTVDRAYLIYLNLYLHQFLRLSDKERLALTMVEVDGASYRAAADALGIRLENLKMVIFRGRKKIFRGLTQTLELLAEGAAMAPTRNPILGSAVPRTRHPRRASLRSTPPTSPSPSSVDCSNRIPCVAPAVVATSLP